MVCIHKIINNGVMEENHSFMLIKISTKQKYYVSSYV